MDEVVYTEAYTGKSRREGCEYQWIEGTSLLPPECCRQRIGLRVGLRVSPGKKKRLQLKGAGIS